MDEITIRTIIAAVLGLTMAVILARSLRREQFRAMRWAVAAGSGLTWGVLALLLSIFFWDSYFTFIKPGWIQWGGLPLVVVFYGLIGLGFWWIAEHTPAPTPVFCALGALWSIPEHLFGIYQMRILEEVPMLSDIHPVSIFVFAFFEYLIFWSAALAVSVGLWRLRPVLRTRRA